MPQPGQAGSGGEAGSFIFVFAGFINAFLANLLFAGLAIAKGL
jgi:hypothetical protein